MTKATIVLAYIVCLVIFGSAAYRIGYLDGKADLDGWFRDQSFVRVHVPPQCTEGIR